MEIKPETILHVPCYRKMASKRYIKVDVWLISDGFLEKTNAYVSHVKLPSCDGALANSSCAIAATGISRAVN